MHVVGEALVDVIWRDGSVFVRPGGSPYNVAVALARQGTDVALHAAVGDDDHGRLLQDQARQAGVDVRSVITTALPTAAAHALIGPNGDAQYRFEIDGSAAMAWEAKPADWAWDGAALHIGSIASWLSPLAEQVWATVDRAIAAGTTLITADPNVRPAVIVDVADTRRWIEGLVRRAHLVKASTEDLRWLYPDRSPEKAAADWSRHGPALAVLTDGADEATAYRDGRAVAAQRPEPVTVRDTIGAGDAFMAGLIASALQQGASSPHGIAELAQNPARIVDLLTAAHRVAANTLTRGARSADGRT